MTLFFLLSVATRYSHYRFTNNEIAFTGNSFLRNGNPALSEAVESGRVPSFSLFLSPSLPPNPDPVPPSPDNHRLHPPTQPPPLKISTLLRFIPQRSGEMKPRCIASGFTRGFMCAQQRELSCNLQRRQLKLSLLAFEGLHCAILLYNIFRRERPGQYSEALCKLPFNISRSRIFFCFFPCWRGREQFVPPV